MNFVSDASGRPAIMTWVRFAVFAAALLPAACGRPSADTVALPEPAPPPQDPLSRFVASAAPGQEGVVTFADGRATRVQVLRAYAAASGRECREVQVGGGRASLLCQAEGQWVQARPLLLGSGAARP